MPQFTHNPDTYMKDLRQILAQGRKRLGLFIGAGAPAAMRVEKSGAEPWPLSDGGQPLIPVVAQLTVQVRQELETSHGTVLSAVCSDLDPVDPTRPNIEQILSKVRGLADVLGSHEVHGYSGTRFQDLARDICSAIGTAVAHRLPSGPNPYSELAAWLGGAAREHSVEVFTTNYDLLLEEALERARIPYFDGFCGAREPFFDPAAVASDKFSSRWVRLWKLHGSLGWGKNHEGRVIRGCGTGATEFIYPTHLKYDQAQKLPYSAFFERLRSLLGSPDSLLLTCGFSFSDLHVNAALKESLAANPGTAVIAFQYLPITQEASAVSLALNQPRISVYARDAAIINGVEGPWRPTANLDRNWGAIQSTYWGTQPCAAEPCVLLGDFSSFTGFLGRTKAAPEPPFPPTTPP